MIMKSSIIVSLGFLIAFSVSSVIILPITLAQDHILTDSDALVYYSNPSNYIDKEVNFTGKILSLLPAVSETQGLQMYQAGDTNRNTIVIYATPIQFSNDDCVRVIGVTQPVTEYQNMFGAHLSAAAINADFIKKIECSESIEPAIKTVNVGQTQEKNIISVTLHKIEYSDKNTRAYLTVENTGTAEDITFSEYSARAIQGKSQFVTTNSYNVDYPKIESTIPAGVEENGVILFEPMDPSGTDAKFRFEATCTSYDTVQFIFDVIISPVEYYDKLLSETNDSDIEILYNISESLLDSGNFIEAIKYYDKALAIDPNDTYALNNKGYALSELGNFIEAIKYYDKALAIDPNDTEVLNNKGYALSNIGNDTEAIKYYDKALAIDPNEPMH